MPTLKIHDATLTGDRIGSPTVLTFDDLTETVTVRELLRARIYQEVDEHNRRVRQANAEAQPFQGLVTPSEVERALNGQRTGKVLAKEVDWNKQFDAACEAFDRNGFLVLVDDRQAERLDETIELRANSDVAFVRLTMLVGG